MVDTAGVVALARHPRLALAAVPRWAMIDEEEAGSLAPASTSSRNHGFAPESRSGGHLIDEVQFEPRTLRSFFAKSFAKSLRDQRVLRFPWFLGLATSI